MKTVCPLLKIRLLRELDSLLNSPFICVLEVNSWTTNFFFLCRTAVINSLLFLCLISGSFHSKSLHATLCKSKSTSTFDSNDFSYVSYGFKTWQGWRSVLGCRITLNIGGFVNMLVKPNSHWSDNNWFYFQKKKSTS